MRVFVCSALFNAVLPYIGAANIYIYFDKKNRMAKSIMIWTKWGFLFNVRFKKIYINWCNCFLSFFFF